MTIRLRLPDYRLFPYERVLAAREVSALGGEVLREESDALLVNGSPNPEALSRLTYVSRIEFSDGTVIQPAAASIEAASSELRGRRGRRQQTRYHLHGIHEYKGKFNPQVVRSLANLLGVEPGTWVLDPFCGSGTALLEGLSLGCNVLGVDRSPIAVLLARGKVRGFTASDPAGLAEGLRRWTGEAIPDVERAQRCEAEVPAGLAHLNAASVKYVRHWFPPGALAGLSAALAHRRQLRGTSSLLAAVAISSLCRTVSYQRPEDLRIRRRPVGFVAPDLAPLFEAAMRNVTTGLEEVARLPSRAARRALVRFGSASATSSYRGSEDANRRVVITSPPYATALPYIDTDRLSVALLGLAGASDLAALERALIGSREWTTPEARRWAAAVQDNRAGLPHRVAELCRGLAEAHSDAGFRRRAVPGLLYRYFTSMRSAFRGLRRALQPGDQAVFIVGSNRTRTSDGPVEIATPELLALVSEQAGFVADEFLPLETFPRYGLHQANGINDESAVILGVGRLAD